MYHSRGISVLFLRAGPGLLFHLEILLAFASWVQPSTPNRVTESSSIALGTADQVLVLIAHSRQVLHTREVRTGLPLLSPPFPLSSPHLLLLQATDLPRLSSFGRFSLLHSNINVYKTITTLISDNIGGPCSLQIAGPAIVWNRLTKSSALRSSVIVLLVYDLKLAALTPQLG